MSQRAWNLGSTLEGEISSAIDRNYLREEIRSYAQRTYPLSKEDLIKRCYNQGLNFRYEMDQIKAEMEGKKTQDNKRSSEDLKAEFKDDLDLYTSGLSELSREELNEKYKALGIKINMNFKRADVKGKEQPQGKVDIESLKQEYKKDLELYTSGLSELSREEFNEKYKALGIKVNMTFKRNDVKKVVSNAKARDVQSTQSELKSNYREIENPTQQIDDNKSIEDE